MYLEQNSRSITLDIHASTNERPQHLFRFKPHRANKSVCNSKTKILPNYAVSIGYQVFRLHVYIILHPLLSRVLKIRTPPPTTGIQGLAYICNCILQ